MCSNTFRKILMASVWSMGFLLFFSMHDFKIFIPLYMQTVLWFHLKMILLFFKEKWKILCWGVISKCSFKIHSNRSISPNNALWECCTPFFNMMISNFFFSKERLKSSDPAAWEKAIQSLVCCWLCCSACKCVCVFMGMVIVCMDESFSGVILMNPESLFIPLVTGTVSKEMPWALSFPFIPCGV